MKSILLIALILVIAPTLINGAVFKCDQYKAATEKIKLLVGDLFKADGTQKN